MKKLYTVGEISALTGVTRKTLFYYDKIKLLHPAALKGPQNQKLYDEDKLEELKRILQYRNAGLTISEIRQISDHPEAAVPIFREALKRLEAQLVQQQESIRTLKQLIEEYSEKTDFPQSSCSNTADH